MLNSKYYILAYFALIVFLTSCKTNYNVVKVDLNSKPSTKDGFYYNLPKNILKISIEIEKQEKIKGPYSDYAKQYFGLTNVITQNSLSYSVKNVSVETIPEIDSSQIYFVETNNSDLKLSFNEMGMLTDINCKEIKDLKTSSITESNINQTDQSNNYPILFRKFADLNMYEKIDTIYKKVKLDTSFIIEKTFKTSLVEKPTDLKVKEIVDYLSKIKEAKFNIITGDVDATDKKNLEFMYNELQSQEEQYLKLFSGITINQSNLYVFYNIPEKDTNYLITKADVCKFSALKGINPEVEGPDVENIFIQIDYRNNLSNLYKYNALKNKKTKVKHGFFYRIPAFANVSVFKENVLLYSAQKAIAQSGLVLPLPQKNVSIKFDDKTGSVILMKIN